MAEIIPDTVHDSAPAIDNVLNSESTTDNAAVIPIKLMFYGEAPEHKLFGDAIKLQNAKGQYIPADGYILAEAQNSRKTKLHFGEVVQLAGDFYTTVAGPGASFSTLDPISDGPENQRATRFDSAVASLLSDNGGYLDGILALLKQQEQGVKTAIANGKDPASVYHITGPPYNMPSDFTMTTTVGNNFKYARIAYMNIDHFGFDAQAAYRVGHEWACTLAKAAARMPGDDAKEFALKEAYLVDAFACHYLTDLFSSGHLRAPRRALHDTNVLTAYTGGTVERPVWDVQSRYMHDDDSAVGQLVTNAVGDSWIAYGDKQFFSDHARLNTKQCISAVRASVQDVYFWFKNGKSSEHEYMADRYYQGLAWAPKPVIAQAKEGTNGFDTINPAPLWVADSTAPGGFTFRSNLNDHSVFTRTPGKPGYNVYPVVTQEAKNVQAASFRKDEKQYPDERPLYSDICGDIHSGGFVQLSFAGHQMFGKPSMDVMARFWMPILSDPLTRSGPLSTSKRIITLRHHRMLDEEPATQEPRDRFMHCLSYSHDNDTSVFRIDLDESTGIVYAFNYNFTDDEKVFHISEDDQTNHYTGWGVLQPIGKKGDDNHEPAGRGPKPPFLGNQSYRWWPLMTVSNMTQRRVTAYVRFFVLDLNNPANLSSPSLVAFSFGREGEPHKVKTAVATLTGKKYDPSQVHETEVDGPVMSNDARMHQFVKSWRDSIFYLRIDESNNLNIHRWYYTQTPANGQWVGYQYDHNPKTLQLLPTPTNGEKPCVLVVPAGVWHQALPLVIVTQEKRPTNQAQVFACHAYAFKNNDWHLIARNTLQSTNSWQTERLCFQGLLPSSTHDSPFHLLQITGKKDVSKNKRYLSLRLFRPAALPTDVPQPQNASNLFRDSVESLIEDPWQDDPNYFSLRFVRSTFEKSQLCVLQVFSFYGILGYRIFNLDESTGIYKLGGQCAYLGQPSQMPGLGCYGQWGVGIMPMTKTPQWLDEAYFTPKNDGTRMENPWTGSWGINVCDENRPWIHGTEPNKKPSWLNL